MKKSFKILLSLGILSLTLTGCGGNGENNNSGSGGNKTVNKYTVTWKNYDGSILETDTNVEEGTLPTYDGATPVRAEDENYTYTFSGSWNPEVVPVTADAVYTAVYESTAKKRFEYQGIEFTDSDCFSDELNNALKELLNSKNFTLKQISNGKKETAAYNTYSLDIYNTINRSMALRFDNENCIAEEKTEAGDIYVLEADVLACFELPSWDYYVTLNEANSGTYDNIFRLIFGNSEVRWHNSIDMGNFNLSEHTPSNGKILIHHVDDSENTIYSYCFDQSVGQFYQYYNGGFDSKYLAPNDYNDDHPQYSLIDEIINSIQYVKADNVTYNSDTKEYKIDWVGSGGVADIRLFSPIKLDNTGHIISLAGYSVTDKGTTKITPDFSLNTCAHEHVSTDHKYFDEDYHCTMCVDCGKIMSWEEHDADNEFGYCEICEHYIGLEDYSPEYLTDDISCSYYLGKTKNGKVVITGDGKGGYSPAHPVIEGADGKTYIIDSAIPENKTEKVISIQAINEEQFGNKSLLTTYDVFIETNSYTYIKMPDSAITDEMRNEHPDINFDCCYSITTDTSKEKINESWYKISTNS